MSIFSRVFGRKRGYIEHILDDVYRINLQVNYAYYISNDEVKILIDTGIREPHNVKRLSNLKGVDYVVLTHGHIDHIGNTRFVKESYGAKVIMHPIDYHYVKARERRDIMKSARYFYEFDEFNIDIPIKESLELPGDVSIIPFPGHTRGSVLVLAKAGRHRRKSILFGGDIIVEEKIGLTLPYPKFSEEPDVLYKNIVENLLKIDFDVVLLSHASRPYSRKEIEDFVRALVR
ncbi:MAG: MBL fold metallo-hydrolase [Euryarchaeota archaeon]|nr:MBL fold metallo-hydrolase [Euryarchaeota archaeon]